MPQDADERKKALCALRAFAVASPSSPTSAEGKGEGRLLSPLPPLSLCSSVSQHERQVDAVHARALTPEATA